MATAPVNLKPLMRTKLVIGCVQESRTNAVALALTVHPPSVAQITVMPFFPFKLTLANEYDPVSNVIMA
jgi:hypothetical protein